jgi:hypothetical protein
MVLRVGLDRVPVSMFYSKLFGLWKIIALGKSWNEDQIDHSGVGPRVR